MSGDIVSTVEDAVTTFNTNNSGKFNKTFRYSKLIEEINDSDDSILGHDTKTQMIKEIFPETNKSFTNTISFFQELKSDNPVSAAQGEFVARSNPAIESELFTFDSTAGAQFRDDGTGALQIVVANTTALQILDANVGSVDYATGNVQITNVTINAISHGTGIKLFGQSNTVDVVGKLSDIVEIKTEDVTVTATGVRE